MGHEHDRGVDRRQLALEPFEALDVEVVGGLVEQEQIRVAGERAAERGAGQLAAREGRELAVEVLVAEAKAAENRRGAVAPVPAAGMLEPRLRCAVAAHRCVVMDAACHRLLELPELLLDPDQIGGARERVFAQRQAAVARGPLIVQCDPGALLQRDLAALDRRLADDRAQQGRLAGAVLARECEPLPAVDRERHAVVGQHDTGSPRVAPHARRRGDHGPARSGRRERGRHGDRREVPRQALQPARPRADRSLHLRPRLRRRRHGRRRVRGRQHRGAPRPRQADLSLRRERGHARRRYRSRS